MTSPRLSGLSSRTMIDMPGERMERVAGLIGAEERDAELDVGRSKVGFRLEEAGRLR
jgi:hypothetical protein